MALLPDDHRVLYQAFLDQATHDASLTPWLAKLPELLAFAMPYLTEIRVDEARFATIRDEQLRGLKNKARQRAIDQAKEELAAQELQEMGKASRI